MLEIGVKRLGYQSLEAVRGMDRCLLGRWVRESTRVRVPWLAEKLGLKTRGGMSYGISWIGRQMEEDGKLKRKWKTLQNQPDFAA